MIRTQTDGPSVTLLDDDRPLGRAAYAVTDLAEGTIQLLAIDVDGTVRRRGYGRRLLHATYDAARAAMHPHPLRRAWAGTGNKVHVIARAFLTGEGYHHVGSNAGVYRDQDLLVYVKSFD